MREALDALAAAGLLTERGATPYANSLSGRTVRLIGAGPVGHQLARLLVASGLGTLYVYDNEPPDLVSYPTAGVLASRSEALRSALADTGTTVSPLSHWSKPEAAMDLTIVACDQPELDRVITDHLVRNDQPHLVVRCWGKGVSVGTAGPCWADLLPALRGPRSQRCRSAMADGAQATLSTAHRVCPPVLLAWAASVAAAQALGYLHGEVPEVCRRDARARLARFRDTAASLGGSSQLRLRLA